MIPKALQPRRLPVRRMPLRKCAKPEFQSEFLRPDQSGLLRKHFSTYRCSNWKKTPLEKTLPFTGAQNVCLQISNSEGGAQKNGYYHSLPYGKMYVPDLKPMCDLDLKTVLFEIKNPYRSTKNPYRRSVRL